MTIRKATIADCELIATIGKNTFLETYLINTPKKDVEAFIDKAFEVKTLAEELINPAIHYHIIYLDQKIAGYSKIISNVTNPNVATTQIAKLDRLYVLKEYHGLQVGVELFNHTIAYSKKLQQQGIWLYVWVENLRAINFYTKNNFQIVGQYDFKISETHYNPNHVMYLQY